MTDIPTSSDHICEDVHGKSKMSSYGKVKMKKHGKNCSNDGFFTCGGCHTKFKTICRLHIHIQRHQEGGSYTYDHITQTAFPKFDSVCTYTQVEQENFELTTQNSDGLDDPFESMQVYTREVETDSIEATRKSKRLANRNNIGNSVGSRLNGVESELNNSNVKALSDWKKDDKNDKADIFVATPLNKQALESENVKRRNITIEYNTRSRRWKRRKAGSESYVDSVQGTNEHQGNITQCDNEKADDVYIYKATKLKFDNMKNMNQKTDEIAASEALIAISKSADGDNKQNINGSIKQTSDRRYSKMSQDILDSGETLTLENKAEECGSNQSNFLDKSPDVNEDNNTIDFDDQSICPEIDDTSQDVVGGKPYASKRMEFPERESFTEMSKEEGTPHELDLVEAGEKQDKWECPKCGKLGSRAMLSYHRYLHKEVKELSCDKCGKQFQHPTCLKVHLKSHDERLYKCEKCQQKFSRKKYLETHMLKHSGEKPYMCETCGKAYRDEMHLKRHIKHVHDQKRDFECDICKERFFRTDHLKCHRIRHFGPGLKCDICHKRFKVTGDLERHMLLHTGEKKWFCHLCHHGFRYPVPYYNHMKKQHNIERAEAGIWRKKLIEENKRMVFEDIVSEDAEDVAVDVSGGYLGHHVSQNVKSKSADDSEETVIIDASSSKTNEPNLPTVRKLCIQKKQIFSSSKHSNSVNTVSTDTLTRNMIYVGASNPHTKVERNCREQTRSSVKEASSTYKYITQHNTNNIVNMADKSLRSLQVLTNLAQEATFSQRGLQFPIQDSFPGIENAGTREDGISGYDDSMQLQDDQIVVIGEETVVEDISVMSEINGENTQAVMFLDETCAGEVVIDHNDSI